jgi:hypothetical protein
MTKYLSENIAIILSVISTLIILVCQFLNVGCEFFKFNFGVVIISTLFCCVFIYAIFLYWKAVYSIGVFMSIFSNLRKWSVFFFCISILLVLLTAKSYEDTLRLMESGQLDHLNIEKINTLYLNDNVDITGIHIMKFAYSICFGLYTSGQMLIFKQKRP